MSRGARGVVIRAAPTAALVDVAAILSAGFLVALAGALAGFNGHFGPLIDGVDYAQIARNLLEGRGFRSDVALPVSIAFPFARELPQPVIYRPPAFPLALVPFLAALGPGDAAVLAAGAAFTAAGAVGAYLLGRRARGRGVGLAGAAAVILSPAAWEEIAHGNAESLALALAAFLVLALAGGRAFAGGVLLGGLLLTKIHMAALLPALFVPRWLRGGNAARRVALLIAGALLVMAPWALRNVRLTGRPFFDLHEYTEAQRARSSAEVYEFHRRAEVTAAAEVVREDPGRILARSGRDLADAARTTPGYLGWGMVALLVAALVRPPPAAGGRDIRGVALAGVALLTVGLAPVSFNARYLLPIVPLLAVAGFDALTVSARSPAARAALVAAVALLAVPPAARLGAAAGALGRGEIGRFRPPATENLRARTRPDDVVLTDDVSIAWYARRRAVWLPWGAADLALVDRAFGIDAVFFREPASRLPGLYGDETVAALVEFTTTQCEPAGTERDGTGWLFLRKPGGAAHEREAIHPARPAASDAPGERAGG